MSSDDAIFIKSLTYSYISGTEPVLKDIDLCLPKGSRTLLIGANGGSSTTFFSKDALTITWQMQPESRRFFRF